MNPTLPIHSEPARWTSRFGYTAAVLTIVFAVVAPILCLGPISAAIGRAPLRIDPIYTGGEVARTIARPGYTIAIYKPVGKRGVLSGNTPFVQVTWKPAAALPARIVEAIDIDGSGRPDFIARFDVPRAEKAPLFVDAEPLGARAIALHGVGIDSFCSMIARVNDAIVLRVPLRGE
jgi:hypothetical protein